MHDEKLRIAADLITLCDIYPPTEEYGTLCADGEPWNGVHGVGDDAVNGAFQATLSHASYFIQQAAPCPVEDISDALLTDVHQLELSIKMLTLLDEGDWDEFKLMKDKLMEKVASNIHVISPLVLRRILSEYSENNGVEALGMGLDLCHSFEQQNAFDAFGLFADMLLHPTVFEVLTATITPFDTPF